MSRFAVTFASIFFFASTVFAGNTHYPDNQPPLKETPYTALPLGRVRARGWLLKQLEMQRDGLTGHAEEALVELNETSAWRGGDKDNWERSPYYVKGLVPLAYTLDDAELKKRAQKWVEWSLASQRADGFYGPKQNDDWWPRMVANYFLRDYAEATNDPRVVPFLTKYYRHMLDALPKRPLQDWGKSRAGDEMDTVVWVYNRTREPFLLELLDLLRKQAYDWPAIFHDNTFQSTGKDFQPRHNVNVPQAMKMPAVSWQRTGHEAERRASDAGHEHLMREHGLSVGMQSGTEFLAGRSPGQGIEFCSIVEQMLSSETIVRIGGDAKHADHLELIAFNALPAAWNRDLRALRYYTQSNHVIARRGRHGFGQDYDNGTLYGPRSGYPCCCFNVHQGWPKFVQNSWAATSGNGLAVIAYAPNSITAKVGSGDGANAAIVQETDYPFGEEVRLKVTMSRPAKFPLTIRTPAWCDGAAATVNGDRVDAPTPGTFKRIEREWKTGDEVVIKLPMSVRVRRGVHESASVHRGPLIYSLLIPHARRVVGQPAPKFDEFEETPTRAWNYALHLDDAFRVEQHPSTDNPFDAATTPIKLIASARKLPGWGLAWNGVDAFDPPASPVQSSEPVEQITLVPFGSQDLRLTDFPVLGTTNFHRSRPRPRTFGFESNEVVGWTWFGGGWRAEGGELRTSYSEGWSGWKALIENATFTDLRIDADVTPPPHGDAGVVFRVSKPSLGADAYEGYYAGVSADMKHVVLGRADGKSWTPLKVVERAFPNDRATKLSITARGDKIEVSVDGEATPVIVLTDDTWKSGQAGVRIYTTDEKNAVAAFDNVTVTPLR